MYLVDTNVISEARRPSSPAAVWIRRVDPLDIHVSVISIGEITRGIAKKQPSDHVFAARLVEWLETLQSIYGDRILPITIAVAETWGRLSAFRSRGDADGLIAATAFVHGLTLVTRNVADFDDTGVALINPWTL